MELVSVDVVWGRGHTRDGNRYPDAFVLLEELLDVHDERNLTAAAVSLKGRREDGATDIADSTVLVLATDFPIAYIRADLPPLLVLLSHLEGRAVENVADLVCERKSRNHQTVDHLPS